MVEIKSYFEDGANWQAKAVLAYLKTGINEVEYASGLSPYKFQLYNAQITVGRYENGREQGYVVCLEFNGKCTYYCIYEHRNSDDIIIDKSDYQSYSINTPQVDTLFSENHSKYDYTIGFPCGSIIDAGKWIIDDMLKIVKKETTSDETE